MDFDLTWDEAVLHVLGSHYPREVDLQTIYFEIGKYRKLNEFDLEITKYGEPRWNHIVRSIIQSLLKKGMIERIRRGAYVLKE